MRKHLTLLILISLGFTSMNLSLAKDNEKRVISKKEMLREIEVIKENADHHVVAIKKIEKYAKRSNSNFTNFVAYAKLASTVPCKTKLFVVLARKTSHLKNENPLLIDLAQIIGSPEVYSNTFPKLMHQTMKAETAEEKRRITLMLSTLNKNRYNENK